MKTQTLISVIVPAYNAERRLALCLDSILNQTFVDFELLLVDDGSTDRTGEICDAYELKDSRCKVIHQENRGVSEARNVGLRAASGAYIAFVDNDDWIHPQYLEYPYRAINEGDYSCSMVLGVLAYIEDIKQDTGAELPYGTKVVSSDRLLVGLFSKQESRRLGEEIPYGVVWARLYKRELLEGMFFKDAVMEDVEYSTRIFNKIKEAIVVPQRMYYWLQSPDSLHRSHSPARVHTTIDCYLSSLDEIPETKQEARGYCLDKLFKSFAYCKYIYRESAYRPFEKEARKKIKAAFERHFMEFICNKHLSFVNKAGLLALYYIPSAYSLLMCIFDIRAKMR